VGLSFTHVSTELERIRKVDIGWWTMGKLLAYSLQDRPFVHLDTDVFLWKPLPRSLTDAPVFAQCPESTTPSMNGVAREISRMRSPNAACHCRSSGNGCARATTTMPARKIAAFSAQRTRTSFVTTRNAAMDLLTSPAHASVWAAIPEKSGFNPVIEQFTLSAFVRYHRAHRESPFSDVDIRYLFPSFMDAYSANIAARLGFTHLLGPSKKDPHIAGRLEQRVQREDPKYYRHCVWLTQNREPLARPGA